MGHARDRLETISGGGALNDRFSIAQKNQIINQSRGLDYAIGSLSPAIDAEWSHQFSDSKALHSYFDYFFTGQDIKVYIDGVENSAPDPELPIMALAFDIEQQKAPVYGFWNYTFNSVMRGTRVVSGVMNIYTTSTDYMARMLSKAATARMEKSSEKVQYAMRGLDEDESLISKYWGKNINADLSPYGDNKNIFSSHPPFNLVIVYGIQSSSITNNGDARLSEVINNYREHDTPFLTDINERLVGTQEDNSMRIVLENIELTKLHVEYQSDGTPLMESYSFFARDIITPKIDTGSNQKRKIGNIN